MKNHVDPLMEVLQKQISDSEQGRITFEQYMACCLYHPEFGYYNRLRPKVGKDGDFYTSANVGSIMGEMIARYILEHVPSAADKPLVLIEWGPGTGKLAHDLLDGIKQCDPAVFSLMEYIAVETSPYHKQVLETNLSAYREKVSILNDHTGISSSKDKNYVILANEFLDALPVRRITKKNHSLFEHWVEWNQGSERFQERLIEADDAHLLNYIQRHGIHVHEGQTVEINLQAAGWVRHTTSLFDKALWLILDYGDVSEDIYGAHRMNGTFLSYYRHTAFSDPYRFPGRQDMTSHVDFTACAREAKLAADVDITLMTQKDFLVKAGILSVLESHDERDPFHPIAKRNRAVRQLLISDQMSELFKVLILEKAKE